jgi:hypothetical protein
MFDDFIQWTTRLNQTNHVGFAVVTVLTMTGVGVGIAVVAEAILRRLSAGRSTAPSSHPPTGH